MKFNCDRCKTRYSISDERVRGKILKIRCKNCSAVITVREGMTVSAPRIPERPRPSTGSAATAMPAPPKPKTPPPPPVTEWYVSIDGSQAGPFDLAGAKKWVAGKPANAELYCWSEGFDDWLPTDKVSHFRGLRPTNGASSPLSVADPSEKTPAPLFAETMKQMTAEAPTLLEDENPFSAAYERKKRATAEPVMAPLSAPAPAPAPQPAPDEHEHELEIGEASRVVKVKDGAGVDPELPKISGLTLPEMDHPQVLRPARRSPLLIPLLAASIILLLVIGILVYLALTGDDDGGDAVRRADRSRSKSIAAGFDDRRTAPDKTPAAAVDAGAAEVVTRSADSGGSSGGNTARKSGGDTGGYTPPPGEVDLSNAGKDDEPVKQGTLDPSDISAMYRRKQFAVNRCYENAIKRDPLLKVPKTYVTLKIAGSGRVTRVSIPSLDGQPLGKCLVASIGRWRFPRSTEGFEGSFPIVFRSR